MSPGKKFISFNINDYPLKNFSIHPICLIVYFSQISLVAR